MLRGICDMSRKQPSSSTTTQISSTKATSHSWSSWIPQILQNCTSSLLCYPPRRALLRFDHLPPGSSCLPILPSHSWLTLNGSKQVGSTHLASRCWGFDMTADFQQKKIHLCYEDTPATLALFFCPDGLKHPTASWGWTWAIILDSCVALVCFRACLCKFRNICTHKCI